MKDTLIVVSTCNRRDLTGITLDSIKFSKHPDTEVLVLDDESEEYGEDWIGGIWGWKFKSAADPITAGQSAVGSMARIRLQEFLKTDKKYLITLDNDVLVSWRFDCKLRHMLQKFNNCATDRQRLVTGYIAHEPLARSQDHFALSTCGGVNHAMTRELAQHLLITVKDDQWNDTWDLAVAAATHCVISTPRSLVQHLGIYGNGVHSGSRHRSIDFIGDESFGGRFQDNICCDCGGRRLPDEIVPLASHTPGRCERCSALRKA